MARAIHRPARDTYVGIAQRDGRRLIAVEMYGDGDLRGEAAKLLDWGFSKYGQQTLPRRITRSGLDSTPGPPRGSSLKHTRSAVAPAVGPVVRATPGRPNTRPSASVEFIPMALSASTSSAMRPCAMVLPASLPA